MSVSSEIRGQRIFENSRLCSAECEQLLGFTGMVVCSTNNHAQTHNNVQQCDMHRCDVGLRLPEDHVVGATRLYLWAKGKGGAKVPHSFYS